MFRIPFNKVCELYKGIQLPNNVEKNKRRFLEIPVADENEDWESGEIPWDLDKNVTISPKKPNKNYEKTPIYSVAMLMM